MQGSGGRRSSGDGGARCARGWGRENEERNDATAAVEAVELEGRAREGDGDRRVRDGENGVGSVRQILADATDPHITRIFGF